MLLLAGILTGGICIWFAIKIGFYETWAMLFNVVIAIYIALFLALPIMDFLPENTVNIPCSQALTLIILAVGTFLILYGITYILFTSQFKVVFPKIFDILFAGLLGFFGGFLLLSFAALIIFLTPFGGYAGMDDSSVEYNMSSAYWLLDGIHSIVSSPDNEITTENVINQLLNKSHPDNQNKNPQQTEPDKPIKTNEA
jgi:uncharacterized membrane protein required for colicin V production